jgi:hypothetical protein
MSKISIPFHWRALTLAGLIAITLSGCLGPTNTETNDTTPPESNNGQNATQPLGGMAIPMRFILTGANGPDGRWTTVPNPNQDVRIAVNCLKFENYSEAEIQNISVTAEYVDGIETISNWTLGLGFFFSEIYWTVNGSLPLAVESESFQSTSAKAIEDNDFIIYLLPNDPTPNLTVREEVDIVVVIEGYNLEALEFNTSSARQCT